MAKVSTEAAKSDSIFSLDDRIGLVLDSVALAKAGFSDMSSMFTLINNLRGEKQCLSSGSHQAGTFVADDKHDRLGVA